MLNSLRTKDIQRDPWQFLVTDFEPFEDCLNGLMSRVMIYPLGWFMVTCYQTDLPVTTEGTQSNFFRDFETEFPTHGHQDAAWQRLLCQRLADHTMLGRYSRSAPTFEVSVDRVGREDACRVPWAFFESKRAA